MGRRQEGRAAFPETPGQVIRTSRWPAGGRGACPLRGWGRGTGALSQTWLDGCGSHTHILGSPSCPGGPEKPHQDMLWAGQNLGGPRAPAGIPPTPSRVPSAPEAPSSACKDCAGWRNLPASASQSPGSLQEHITLGLVAGKGPRATRAHWASFRGCRLHCICQVCFGPFLALPLALGRTLYLRGSRVISEVL